MQTREAPAAVVRIFGLEGGGHMAWLAEKIGASKAFSLFAQLCFSTLQQFVVDAISEYRRLSDLLNRGMSLHQR